MKKIIFLFTTFSYFFLNSFVNAQIAKTFKNDVLAVEEYTLDNGLRVIFSKNVAEPRIHAVVAVRAGGKNDPANATGLAHYLEHMLFKGTDKFGTTNFAQEKPILIAIENEYENYIKTKDVAKRKLIYKKIDSLSGEAAKNSIANEYDKMMSGIGGVGVNAFTSYEQTVYFEQIPSNQLENWIKIQSERFRNPQMRIFHTELEAVYEEKNISLDSDDNKMFETLNALLFKKHTYGTQTIIGTIDHLKNPSIKKIMEYYNNFYVPNNMCIVLAGDVNPAVDLPKLKAAFGDFKSKQVATYKFLPEKPILKPLIKKIYGPDPAALLMGYRTGGIDTKDALYNKLFSYLLSNATAGLIDININQQQKAIEASCNAEALKDYGMVTFYAKPKEGQTLDALTKLLMEEIEKVKKGDFPDWMIEACINNLSVNKTKGLVENNSRALYLVQNFVYDRDYQKEINDLDDLSKITKQELIAYVNKTFKNNYVAVHKLQGEDKNIIKVEKPSITPVETNPTMTSAFAKEVLAFKPIPTQPSFVDFSNSISRTKLINNADFWYTPNTQNDLFTLNYTFDNNTTSDKSIELAIKYINLLGSTTLSAKQLNQEFFKLGCSFYLYTNDLNTQINISGLNKNFEPALKLLNTWLFNLKADETVFKNLIEDELKTRADYITDKSEIFRSAMTSYALFGKNSPYKFTHTNTELKALKPQDLLQTVKEMLGNIHKVAYYGNLTKDNVVKIINPLAKENNAYLTAFSSKKYEYNAINENEILFYNYKGMQQAELIIYVDGEKITEKDYAYNRLLNEYYGGSMASVVFQTIRESKALAYSTRFSHRNANLRINKAVTSAYIGTQADKLKDAISSMFELLNTMQNSPVAFDAAKTAIKQDIQSDRKIGNDLFNYIYTNELQGLNFDKRKFEYNEVDNITIDKLKKYFENKISNKKFRMILVGDETKIDKTMLEKFAKVNILNNADIFNF